MLNSSYELNVTLSSTQLSHAIFKIVAKECSKVYTCLHDFIWGIGTQDLSLTVQTTNNRLGIRKKTTQNILHTSSGHDTSNYNHCFETHYNLHALR
jgi:hypothetical protein